MNEMIRCMQARRSIRKYLPTQITEEALTAILTAGCYAPSAGGRQSTLFVACQNAQVNEALGKINRDTFPPPTDGKVHVSADQPSIADSATLKSAFYGAPTVVTFFAPPNFRYADADCAVAAQNMMLAAESLGVASCMIGRAGEGFASEYGKALQAQWGIPADYNAMIHVILGYIDGENPKAKPRKEGRIHIVK